MNRLFTTNHVRRVETLNGVWDFQIEGADLVDKMPVPACWEMLPDYSTYRGKATYTKQIMVEGNSNLRLVFKGVSHTARVFFDGKFVGEHYNAFTPFDFIINNVESGVHEVKVEVDNSFGEHSALHIPNDYYTYGGITRGVAIEYVKNLFIERVEFVSTMTNAGWQGAVKAYVKIIDEVQFDVTTVKATLAEQEFELVMRTADAEYAIFEAVATFDNVHAWSHEEPNLYFLEVSLREREFVIDDLIERVGFRDVRVEEEKILLNGDELFLKGFNRHEDHAEYGCSLGLTAMMRDVALLKDLGSNMVRTSHYPNDELFLDLCDEYGLYVWEENHARGLSEQRMRNPNFDRQCEDCIDEMVKNHFNHPSIIIWGVLNECASNTEYGRACYEKQIAQIKSLDSTRPVTFATCHQGSEMSLEFADIVSWNLYYGWYSSVPTAAAFEKLLAFSDSVGGAGKPFIMSEFGGGAIPGYRDVRRVKWSEERQCDILEDNLDVYLNHPRISGALVWQFCDCLVTEEEWSLQRPRTKNNKGVVDEYRRPKLAYETVKRRFHDLKRGEKSK